MDTDTVLITGAAGWLGKGLATALVQGLPEVPRLASPRGDLKIRCLVRPGEDTAYLSGLTDRIALVPGDVRNPDDCRRLCEGVRGAVLFHTAAVIHPNWSSEFDAVNHRGSRNVLEAAASAGVKRAVVVSSNSPIGCNPRPDRLFDEDAPYNPYMGYGRSKMRMELFVRELQASGRIETVVVRPPWFYGPHQPARQTLFFRMIRDGKGPIVGGGENRRSMAYIDNLSQGLLLAAITPEAVGRTYWIADARPYTMNEIIDTVERLLEKEFGQTCVHKRMRLPGIASKVAYAADGLIQGVGLYNQKVHVLSEMNKTIACDIGRARRELGYDPKVELEEGMRRSLKWCFERGMMP
jgi:nucleoside-diphosphate-sugar epimerase